MNLIALMIAGTVVLFGGADVETQQHSVPPEVARTDDGEPTPGEEIEDGDVADIVWHDQIVVTPSKTEQERLKVTTNASVLTRQDVDSSAAVTSDQFLRQVPGFSMLRQSNSISAAIQVQAVSFRGLGSAASSRALMLVDGTPLNDPFGSWVYFGRIPPANVEKVEVIRGGAANIWGNLSLSGVVNVLTEKPRDGGLSLNGRVGEQETVDLSAFVSDAWDGTGVSLFGNYFDTGGFPLYREEQMGTVDTNVAKQASNLTAKLEHALSDSKSLYASLSYFEEDREKGTPLNTGASEVLSLSAGTDLITARDSLWQLSFFAQESDFEDFSGRVARDRNSETPDDTVIENPTSSLGLGAVWLRQVSDNHRLMAGADGHWIDTEYVAEAAYDADLERFTEGEFLVGKQLLSGFFLKDSYTPSARLSVELSGRVDYVRNNDAAIRFTNLVTGEELEEEVFSDSSESTINPHIGFVYQASASIGLRGAVYRGFRAPTMSQLYRTASFRDTINRSNPDLAPERLNGVEIATDWVPSSKFFGRLTGFRNELEDVVTNVTIGVAGPGGELIEPCGFVPEGFVCRERQNVNEVLSKGVELELDYRPVPRWRTFLSYLYNDSSIQASPDNPRLEGKTSRQAPEHQVVWKIDFADPASVNATVQGRYVSERYEDDLNTLEVGSFFLLDLMVSRQLSDAVGLYVGVENLLDEDYEVSVSRSGLVEIGSPRLAHISLRYRR